MKILLVGEDREGSLLRSLEFGLKQSSEVFVLDPASQVTELADAAGLFAVARRRVAARNTGCRFLEAVENIRPDIVLIVKGRGIAPEIVTRARSYSRIAIYYPDNPFWLRTDSSPALVRLRAADLVLVWSRRLQDLLSATCDRVSSLAFGYDDRWFPLTDPSNPRAGVAFVGTWSRRRQRYVDALAGLPLRVVGSGWSRCSVPGSGLPAYGQGAGALLRSAAIGLNIFHPHNSGAHNMRTREIAASGAVQLTDPGTDGTPLRDGSGCRWFRSPQHLRELVEQYLSSPSEAAELACRAQQLIADDTYRHRSAELIQLFEVL